MTRDRRAGRGALLWGLGLFACLQLALLALTDSWLAVWRDPLFAARAQRLRHRLDASPRPPRLVVVLGSSLVLQGVPGRQIEGRLDRELDGPFVFCNLGLPSATPMDEMLTWKRLQDAHVRPDLLLVEALPMNLDRGLGLERQASPVERLSRHDLALMRQAGMPVDSLRRPWLEAAAVPSYSRRRAIVSRVAPSLLPPDVRWQWTWPQYADESGWLRLPDVAATPEYRRRALAHLRDVWPGGVRVTPGGLPCQALGQILRECRAEGIPVALLVMPESPEFRRWYRPEEWRQVEDALDRLSRQHHVPVVVAREWLGEEMFMDGQHLLAEGAVRFADHLTDEFLLPFFRGRSLSAEARP